MNTRAAIRAAIADLNSETYTLLKDGRLDAARLAGRLSVEMQADLLSEVFTAGQIEDYARQEAARAASALENSLRRMRGDSYKPLSEQVYKTGALSKGMVDAKINVMIAQGASAVEIAAAARRFINPDVPGGVSYASMRLGRTELNNAFHASAAARYQASPFVQNIEWNLSGSHPRNDICDELANEDVGFGAGVYPPDDVPEKPHPQCLCYITPELMSDEEFINKAARGDFDNYLSPSGEGAPLFGEPDFRLQVSPNPDVRRKVANLTPEQRKMWMGDHRPVARKMADPKYATPGDTGTFTPTPRPPRKPPTPKRPPGNVVGPDVPRWVTDVKPTSPAPARVRVDTGGVKVSQANVKKIGDTWNDLNAQYPKAFRYSGNDITVVTKKTAPGKYGIENAYADFSPASHEIRVSTKLLNEGKERYEWNIKQGWFTQVDPNDPIRSTLSHEFGHHLDYSLSGQQAVDMWNGIADALGLPHPAWKDGGSYLTPIDDWHRAHLSDISNKVSKYAATNRKEMVAELFAEGQAPGPAALFQKWEADPYVPRTWPTSGRAAAHFVVAFMRGAFA